MMKKTDNYNITIGFSTTRLFMSRLIRWATGSSCSHCFIVFNDRSLGMRMVMQAEVWGYELRPLKRWARYNILVAEFKPIGRDLDDALRDIARNLGTKFDYQSAITIGIKSLFTSWHRNRFSLRPDRDPWKLTCSEAVIRFLKCGKYETVAHLNPETTSPGELLREILRNRREFKSIHINRKYLLFDKNIRISPNLLNI